METIKNFFRFLFFNKTNPLSEADSFKDDLGTEKPFKPHYDKYILPHVIEFEAKRIEALKKFKSRLLIAIALFGFLYGLLFVFVTGVKALEALEYIIVLFFIIGRFAYQPIRKYKSSVKSIIFPKIFSFFGDNYKYNNESPLSISVFEGYEIVPYYDKAILEDYVKGSYKEVVIEFFSANLLKKGSKGRQCRVFHGIVICLTMNKNFNGKTIVVEDAGMVNNWLKDKFSSLQVVNLEDPTFENQFEVYSNDQIEARYLLTTTFMERLLALSSMFNNQIKCSFYNKKLLFMIDRGEDTFKTSSIFLPSTFEYDIKTVLIEMQAIFNIIDTLKLSEKTGL
ncbi:MAG: DUF3137 domain-containing protein [Alphaproteobacteria bacterium]|jgi:hypothetical protein